jgi:hypothetical protein
MATFYPPIDWTLHPLHAAADRGNRAEVERLIAAGANVNQVLHLSVRGAGLAGTPLHVALFDCGDNTSLYRGHHEWLQIGVFLLLVLLGCIFSFILFLALFVGPFVSGL